MRPLICLVFSVFVAIMTVTTATAQEYSLFFKVKTKLDPGDFPALVSNKHWDGAKVIDLISTSNMGKTLESGKEIGWTVFIQPNGAWGWNIGDGEQRLDYLPTVRQRINDGKWHEVGVVFYKEKKTAWLYFDQEHVAIYSLSELKLDNLLLSKPSIHKEKNGIAIKVLNNDQIKRVGQSTNYVDLPEKLTVMSWNIWHGGRHNGIKQGIRQTIEAIQNSGADIICMQETYGSGPAISDALRTVFYYRSSNLSIHSKFPIIDTYDSYQAFRFGGVRLKMGRQLLDVFSLWIHYLPSISKMYPGESVTKILLEENKTRGSEIKEILESITFLSKEKDEVPIIIGGDFNSPSHLDWGADMKSFHHGYEIIWPVSKQMENAGFTDAFRKMGPIPANSRGFTWSPRFDESLQSRIDYLYYKGNLNCVNSFVMGYTDDEWPSDHAAVVAQFRIKSMKVQE